MIVYRVNWYQIDAHEVAEAEHLYVGTLEEAKQGLRQAWKNRDGDLEWPSPYIERLEIAEFKTRKALALACLNGKGFVRSHEVLDIRVRGDDRE